ncbi:hypothetical protein Tco_0831126 [Tanacetum coccineum]
MHSRFKSFAIQNIPRNLNQKADILSKLATHAFDHLTKKVLVEVLAERLTDRKEEVSTIVEEEEDNWMTPIIRCLDEGVWPKDKEERIALRMKINQYILEEGVLFKKGLTYGSEAVIPAEIGMPTHRTMMIRESKNEDELRLNIDLLQERREVAAIREAKCKTKMEQYYNQKVIEYLGASTILDFFDHSSLANVVFKHMSCMMDSPPQSPNHVFNFPENEEEFEEDPQEDPEEEVEEWDDMDIIEEEEEDPEEDPEEWDDVDAAEQVDEIPHPVTPPRNPTAVPHSSPEQSSESEDNDLANPDEAQDVSPPKSTG